MNDQIIVRLSNSITLPFKRTKKSNIPHPRKQMLKIRKYYQSLNKKHFSYYL